MTDDNSEKPRGPSETLAYEEIDVVPFALPVVGGPPLRPGAGSDDVLYFRDQLPLMRIELASQIFLIRVAGMAEARLREETRPWYRRPVRWWYSWRLRRALRKALR